MFVYNNAYYQFYNYNVYRTVFDKSKSHETVKMAEGGGRSQKKRSSIVALMESSYPKLETGVKSKEPHPNSREAREFL